MSAQTDAFGLYEGMGHCHADAVPIGMTTIEADLVVAFRYLGSALKCASEHGMDKQADPSVIRKALVRLDEVRMEFERELREMESVS